MEGRLGTLAGDPRRPLTSFEIRGRAMRLDSLTQRVGRERETPLLVARLAAPWSVAG